MEYFTTLRQYTIYTGSTKKVKVLDMETGKTYNYNRIFNCYDVLQETAY